MCTDLSKWEKDVKILGSQVNAHQKVTLAEDEVGDQVQRTVSLFPSRPAIVQWSMNNVAMVVETEVLHELDSTGFHSPRLT